jgi:hypothetical protein
MKSNLVFVILVVALLSVAACTPKLPQTTIAGTPTSVLNQVVTEEVKDPSTPTLLLDPTANAPLPKTSITNTVESLISAGNQFHLIDKDIWTQSEITPSDVIDQISLVKPGSAGGGGPCLNPPENASDKPFIYYLFSSRKSNLSVNELGYICFHNFKSDESIALQILDPNDNVIRSESIEINNFMGQGSASTEVLLVPGAPLGIYKVLAEGKIQSANSVFLLVKSDDPILAVESDHQILASISKDDFGYLNLQGLYVQPGSDIVLYLTGFPPNQPVTIHVFKSTILYTPEPFSAANYVERLEFTYISTVNQELVTDSSGEISAKIPTDQNSHSGLYFLVINGTSPQRCAFEGLLLSTYGEIEKMNCDLILLLNIGDLQFETMAHKTESLPCPNTLPSQLAVGTRAMVSTDPPLANTVRATPNLKGEKTGIIPAGQEIELLEGPRCVNDYNWWRVKDLKTNLTGWTAEGDHKNYWLVPIQ